MNRIKQMKKYFMFFLVLIVMDIYGYEMTLFPKIDYFDEIYNRDYANFSLFDISSNPALYHLTYSKKINIYQISSGRNIAGFRRYFDPGKIENINAELLWNYKLDEKSLLATGVNYYQTNNKNVERSLEKYHYDHYFSISDTTNGNIIYKGPKLWLLYNHKINENFTFGLKTNYGVERGLKDKFTECETVIRDIDVSMGLSYISDSRNSIVAINGRYFDRQAKYEAVAKQVSANVDFWYGYHIYKDEDSYENYRKNDDRQGYELSLQWEQKDIMKDGLGIRFAGSFGELKNNIVGGKVSNLTSRAYWQRSAFQFSGNMFYDSGLESIQFYCIYSQNSDWANPKDYDIISLENDIHNIRIGGKLDMAVSPVIKLLSGFELSAKNIDYKEYTSDFTYKDVNNSTFFMLGANFSWNQISTLYLRGNYQTEEPDFQWQGIEKISVLGAKIGMQRQFTFTKLDCSLFYNIGFCDEYEEENEEFGIEIMIQK